MLALTYIIPALVAMLQVQAISIAPRESAQIEAREAYNPFRPPHPEYQQEQIRKHLASKKKRSFKKRKECAIKTGTTQASASPTSSASSVRLATASASTSLIVQNAPAILPSSTVNSPVMSTAPSSSSTARSSSSAKSVTPSSSAAAAVPTSSGFQSVDREGNGPFNGETTYYNLGSDGSAIGACGTNLVDSDLIAAASDKLFDNWPGANGNPNQNPICGQFAKVSYQGKSVIVRIADRCPGCDQRHLDLSPSAFTQLAPESVGLMDVTWSWVGSASG